MLWHLLADAVLVFHLAFIALALAGGLLAFNAGVYLLPALRRRRSRALRG